ncbi:hypothetical protein LTY04_001116 [Clostridium perfringens]
MDKDFNDAIKSFNKTLDKAPKLDLSKLKNRIDDLNKATIKLSEVGMVIGKQVERFNKSSNKIKNALLEFSKNLDEIIKNIDFSVLKCTFRLRDIGWLPCLDLTKEEKIEIVNTLQEINEENIKQVNDIIFKHYTDEIIDKIYNEWLKNTYIKKERFELLKQAIECYKNNYFAACVSLITCQYGGIIYETEQYFNSIPGLRSEINKIKNEQRQERKKVSSEKNTVDRIYGVSDFQITTMVFNDYFKKYVYCDSKYAKDNIPNRNGICHGSLINYNTQEHALKSILIVDSLIRLYMFIDIEEKLDIGENSND